MNIPMPTWDLFIVVDGKIESIGTYTSVARPSKEKITEIAKEHGFESFTDYQYVLTDDGMST